jgi:hypothetical protein
MSRDPHERKLAGMHTPSEPLRSGDVCECVLDDVGCGGRQARLESARL